MFAVARPDSDPKLGFPLAHRSELSTWTGFRLLIRLARSCFFTLDFSFSFSRNFLINN
jgi:hypothetical protein